MESRGKFIVIEGIDGSGKSTQVKLLKERLNLNHNREKYENIHFTREASDGPIGKLLRYTYLAGKRLCDERVINMLYAADRFDHITNADDGMIRFIEHGTHVISDRYYLSSMAYNTYMMPTKDKVIEMINHTITMNRYIMETLRPDVTIYIDLDPANALYRINAGRDENSVYETAEKLTKIHDAYDISMNILRDKYDENIIVVDGNRSISDIHEEIYSIVCDVLDK